MSDLLQRLSNVQGDAAVFLMEVFDFRANHMDNVELNKLEKEALTLLEELNKLTNDSKRDRPST